MANRTLYSSASTPPTSGNDYMDQTSDHLKVMFDAMSLPLTSVAGTADAVTATADPSFDGDGLVNGMRFGITWASTNTSTVTLNVNGVGALAVVDKAGDALVAGDLVAGTRDTIEVVSGVFRLTTEGGGGGGIGAVLDTQTFLSSGTWTKPSEGSWARIRIWGAGGGGAATSSGGGGGGGGGAYSEYMVPLSVLGATEAATVAAGGVGTSGSAAGGDGGYSQIDKYYANGGNGGPYLYNSYGHAGGSGAMLGGWTGYTNPYIDERDGNSVWNGGDGASGANADVGGSVKGWHGGGGGGGAATSGNGGAGGSSEYGGGGGGGGSETGSAGAGGASTNSGAGGAGGAATGNATNGSQPGGGGGGSRTGTSGNGGDGKIIVEVY